MWEGNYRPPELVIDIAVLMPRIIAAAKLLPS
jgi:hypothetical protein